MDHFDDTTGVLDSWDLLNNSFLDTFVDRNKERVRVSSLNLFQSSTSLLVKKTSYRPVLNSISAGYYPVLNGFYKSCPSTYDKPLIRVTVSPRSHKTTTSDTQKRRQHRRIPNSSNHSICSKKIYLVIPGTRKDKVYAIETTNAKIFKEINDNKLLSECMIKSYYRSMNKTKRKNSDNVKEKRNLKSIPECSPDCAFMSISKSRNVSSDRSGSASPRSPRTSYKTVTKIEAKKSATTTATQRTTKSPDRFGVKDEDAKTKSPVRTSRQNAKISIYRSENNKKEEEKSPDRYSYVSDKRSIESIIAETKRRSPDRYEKKVPNKGRPDRIRITGRLGIDEDDKCVLKCNATLNDEPILTQFQGGTCAMLPMCFQACKEENRSSRMQRDVNIQVKQNPANARLYSRSEIGKESQATQVDFQMSYTTPKFRREECGRGKVMQQCACVSTSDQKYEAEENTGIALKKNHSPLIVISVYSKNDASSENSVDLKQKQFKTTEQKKEVKKTGRSRSPSPAKSSKKTSGKKSDTRVNATAKKTVRETARKEIKSKVSQTQSKSTIRSTVRKSKFESKTSKNNSSKLQKTPPQSRRSTSPQINPQEANVTEQMKRALIDDFTKSYTEHMNNKTAHLEIPLQTKHNVSNITIDIEGDSDYYNVKLEQDARKFNTELTVRKPPRGGNIRSDDMEMAEKDTTSLENFLYMPGDEPRKRSFSQTLMFDGLEMTMNSDLGDENELKVRDSIEISHRRENRASIDGNYERNSNDISNGVDTEFLAHRHFKDDGCVVSDPDARDREIRKLLGIDKGVTKCRLRPSKSSAIEKGVQALFTRANENISNTTLTHTNTENPEKQTANSANTITLAYPLYQTSYNQNLQLLYELNTRKPIVLTRHQYAKVKRIIYSSLISKTYNAKLYNSDRRLHEKWLKFETDSKNKILLHFDKDSQTDRETLSSGQNTYTIHEGCGESSPSKEKDKYVSSSEQETYEYSSTRNCTKVINYNNYYMHNVERAVYIAAEHVPTERFKDDFLKKAASVRDVGFRRTGGTKHRVRFSSSDSGKFVTKPYVVEKHDSCSIHTIFKYNKKSITPNLGTSANSLCDGEPFESRVKFLDDSTHDLKPKKAFLRRLISCLVFKVSPSSETKCPGIIEHGSPHSSFDSYHVSSSLAAREMSSSLYDTTASCYSEHAAHAPAPARRPLLRAVRALLARTH